MLRAASKRHVARSWARRLSSVRERASSLLSVSLRIPLLGSSIEPVFARGATFRLVRSQRSRPCLRASGALQPEQAALGKSPAMMPPTRRRPCRISRGFSRMAWWSWPTRRSPGPGLRPAAGRLRARRQAARAHPERRPLLKRSPTCSPWCRCRMVELASSAITGTETTTPSTRGDPCYGPTRRTREAAATAAMCATIVSAPLWRVSSRATGA